MLQTVQGIVQSGLLLLCTELTLFCIELPENCICLNQSELSNSRCRVPSDISNHGKGDKTWPKCDRGIGKRNAQITLKKTGVFPQVDSGDTYSAYFSIQNT